MKGAVDFKPVKMAPYTLAGVVAILGLSLGRLLRC